MDGPSYLTWDEATAPLALAIRLSTMHAPAIELDVTRELRSITYLNPDEVGNGYPVMAVVRKAVNPDDTGQLSRITLQFDSRNADWSGARYRALVEWLTARAVGQGIDVSVCRPLVAETLWDTAARVAQRHESETSNPHSGCVQIVSAVPAEAATAGERGNESAVVNAQGHVEPAGNANARSGEQNGIQVSLAHTFCPLLYFIAAVRLETRLHHPQFHPNACRIAMPAA
ncbi:hypothetical protein B0H11DRAFT_1136835 [Mycena galericulata]|nr:hypothetical protein B0H11DRAFT_1136835 [Mycena galericulata]